MKEDESSSRAPRGNLLDEIDGYTKDGQDLDCHSMQTSMNSKRTNEKTTILNPLYQDSNSMQRTRRSAMHSSSRGGDDKDMYSSIMDSIQNAQHADLNHDNEWVSFHESSQSNSFQKEKKLSEQISQSKHQRFGRDLLESTNQPSENDAGESAFWTLSNLNSSSREGNGENRDEIVRSGRHLKTLVENALRQVKTRVSTEGDVELLLNNSDDEASGTDETEHHDNRTNRRKRSRQQSSTNKSRDDTKRRRSNDREENSEDIENQKYTSQLVIEKMSEVMTLKRELKEAQEHAKAMANANSTLRHASTTSAHRIEALSEALRIAGEKAANARADADAAEVRASSASSKLKSFKNAMDQTKKVVEAVKAEHDEISSFAKDLESRLMQKESELCRMQKEKSRAVDNFDQVSGELLELKAAQKAVKEELTAKSDELVKLKRTLVERQDLENARTEMSGRLERELRKARSLIVELTSSSSEAESTTAELQETISNLQKEITSLHEKLKDTVENAAKERSKMNEAMEEVESEAQKLRMKSTADDEEINKLRLDKSSFEKEIEHLKNRIINLEKRSSDITDVETFSHGDAVSDTSSLHADSHFSTPSSHHSTPSSSSSTSSDVFTKSSTDATTKSTKQVQQYHIPKLKSMTPNMSHPKEKDSRGAKRFRSQSHCCSICFKNPYGIMKACQCGNPACNLRAHTTCISGKNPTPSVSFPGTPAPSLPTILCSSISSRK